MNPAARRGSAAQRALAFSVLLALSVAAILLGGCGGGSTLTWSSRLISPGGRWTAVAESRQWGGPGNAFDATQVLIGRTGSERRKEVLLLSSQFATMNLRMKWPGPDALCVAYGPSARPGDSVQVERVVSHLGQLEITARPISTNQTAPCATSRGTYSPGTAPRRKKG